jgi:hypothetical protein
MSSAFLEGFWISNAPNAGEALFEPDYLNKSECVPVLANSIILLLSF